MDFNFKRIADAVHKTVGLSEIEVKLIETPAFQRLRHIKHLGLADYVFPGADFSRLAHCIGVCHVTGLILEGIQSNMGRPLSDEQIQRYRVAGLLHDVGHYPFSHVMDHAVHDFYLGTVVRPDTGPHQADQAPAPEEGLSHERVGVEILQHDPLVRELLHEAHIDPQPVADIITRTNPLEKLANLISSDLDADKVDYLLRTANSTGLPYGQVDLPYMATQAMLDDDGLFCFSEKAIRLIDHLMLARYFDRMQVAYHKTVAGLELVLEEVLHDLLRSGLMSLSAADIRAYVSDPPTWCQIDDGHVIEKIRRLRADADQQVVRDRAEAILHRQPPKQIAWAEYFGGRDDDVDLYRQYLRTVNERMPTWADASGIPVEYWTVWKAGGFTLSSLASTIPVPISRDKIEPEKREQAVHVLPRSVKKAMPIVRVRSSMMSILSDKAFFGLRIYVLKPSGSEVTDAQLSELVADDLGRDGRWEFAT